MAAIAHRFVATPPAAIDGAVTDALAEIGAFVGADAVGLLVAIQEGGPGDGQFEESHAWIDPIVGPLPPHPSRMPAAFTAEARAVLRTQDVWLGHARELGAGAEQRRMMAVLFGALSGAWLPIWVEGRLVGIVAMLWRARETTLAPDDLNPFRIVGAVLLGTLARRRAEADRQRLAEALEAERRRLREIVATLPGMIWEVQVEADGGHALVFLNDYAVKLLGYSLEDLSTHGFWTKIVHRDDQAIIARALEDLGAGREPPGRTSEIRWWRRDGELIFTEVRYAALRDPAGRLIGLRGVTMDITEQRRTEAQLENARRMEALGRLAGGVAHDFNNMLLVIGMQAEAAMSELANQNPAGLERQLLDVREAVERASRLTRQLLAIGRRQVLAVEPLSLSDAVRGLRPMLGHLMREDIRLEMRLDTEALVRADPTQLDQVLVNLVANARDAMPTGGRLTIETCERVVEADAARALGVRPGRWAVLVVSDTGVGMDAETQGQIFQPFFSTKQRGQGTGLGLATVHGIVTQHGGHVRVESAPGQGSWFEVFLPLASGVSDAPTPSGAEAGLSTPGSGETVLLVEDERQVRQLAARLLLRSGFRVLEAGGGDEALALAAGERRLDLLVTDVVMPGMNGPELHALLRRSRPSLPVLYISGYTDDLLGHHGVLDPGTYFLPKPFTGEAFVTRVKEALAIGQ